MTGAERAREAILEQAHRGDRLRAELAARPLVGTFIMEHPTAAAVRGVALAGFDYAILDLEHGAAGESDLPYLVAVAETVRLPVIVRVADPDPGVVSRVLDLLPAGVMFPRVPDAATAALWAAWCTHPPYGSRGYAPITSAAAAGLGPDGPRPLLVFQIETTDALREAGAIAQLPAADVVFVGPYDLAMALGTVPDPDDPVLAAAVQSVADTASVSAVLGAYVRAADEAPAWVRRGFGLLCVGFDGAVFRDGMARLREEIAAAMEGAP